jgi:TolB protein
MKPKTILVLLSLLLATGALMLLTAQQADINVIIRGNGDLLKLAVPDLRGAGDAAKFMQTFNDTLWKELDNGGVLTLVAKSVYPLNVPQRPEDFVPPTGRGPSTGPWLTDWSGSPVNANDLAFGYTAAQGGLFVLYGNLYNLSQPTPATAQLFRHTYTGSLDEAGARKVARDFAAEILAQFGGRSLAGSQIYFVSDRTGPRTMGDGTKVGVKEIWCMDYDGSNQRQLTFYKGLSMFPSVSADGKMFAFTSLSQNERNGHLMDDNPIVMIQSVETGRKLSFYSPKSSIVSTPEFTPDGKHVLLSTKIGVDKDEKIYIADLQGGDLNAISHATAIEVEAKVNPKNGSQVAFISGRTGPREQLWLMGIDGGNAQMLTPGDGYVANPSWSPDGQWIAFAWTHGFEYGQFNIFIMNVATRQYFQLTHNAGVNENPTWAPDGKHIAFTSRRGRTTQVFTMLADGTHIQQLTTQGNNFQPVWVKGIN